MSPELAPRRKYDRALRACQRSANPLPRLGFGDYPASLKLLIVVSYACRPAQVITKTIDLGPFGTSCDRAS